jgi:hypothetical protein
MVTRWSISKFSHPSFSSLWVLVQHVPPPSSSPPNKSLNAALWLSRMMHWRAYSTSPQQCQCGCFIFPLHHETQNSVSHFFHSSTQFSVVFFFRHRFPCPRHFSCGWPIIMRHKFLCPFFSVCDTFFCGHIF